MPTSGTFWVWDTTTFRNQKGAAVTNADGVKVGDTYRLFGEPHGAPLAISDDDAWFEDGFRETGAPSVISDDFVLKGVNYRGSRVESESILTFRGDDGSTMRMSIVNIVNAGTGNSGELWLGETLPSEGVTYRLVAKDTGGETIAYRDFEGGVVTCFAAGTRIGTPAGPRPIESLALGDPVLTLDHGAQPIRWIGERRLRFPPAPDRHRPIRIRAGALGPGRPARDLVVSPQHRLLLGPGQGLLVPAKALLGSGAGEAVGGRIGIRYLHLLFDRHEIVTAEGAPAESFRPGPTALAGLTPEARREILALFPALGGADWADAGPGRAARRILTVTEGRRLAPQVSLPALA